MPQPDANEPDAKRPDPVSSEPAPSEPAPPNSRQVGSDASEAEIIDLEPIEPAPAPPRAPEREPDAEAIDPELPEPFEVRIDSRVAAPGPAPLVKAGMGGARLPLGLGATILVGALIASGLRASGMDGAGARFVALAVAVTLFQTLLHTGTGVAAVMVAARLEARPTGALETAAARMFAAVAAFQLVYHLPALVPGFVGLLIGALTGLAVYALVVWALFRLSRLELGVVVSGHVLLLIAMMLGTHLTHLYRSAEEGLAGAAP